MAFQTYRSFLPVLAAVFLMSTTVAAAPFNPETAVTVFVHGFDEGGWERTGVFGDDSWDGVLDNLILFCGLPTMMEDPSAPNQVASTTFYGDTPPDYYTQDDLDELDAITEEFGGGVPRYALIAAKYIRHVMERSGAESVNVIGASFGALVSRYMLAHDMENLASDAVVDRWLIYVGSLAGNFAASNIWLVEYYEAIFGDLGPDIDHMNYEWVSENIWPDPWESGNPLLGGIIKFHFMGSDHSGTFGALTLLSGGLGNDSTTLHRDGRFRYLEPPARFSGIYEPTSSYYFAIHHELSEHVGVDVSTAWALLGPRRVKIDIKDVYIPCITEPAGEYPGEVVFQARFYSPCAYEAWGVDRAIDSRSMHDNNVEIYEWNSGEEKTINETIFYGPVSIDETYLFVNYSAVEVDWWPIKGIIDNFTQENDVLVSNVAEVPLVSGEYMLPDTDVRLTIEVTVEDLY